MVLGCPKCGANYNIADYKPQQKYGCKKCKVVLEPRRPTESKVRGGGGTSTLATGAPTGGAGKPDASDSQIIPHEETLRSSSVAHTESQQIELEIPKGWRDKLCDTTIGGYKIIRKLGQGGMGMIYKAEQLSLNRIVALKMLNDRLASDESFLKRFINEAKFVAKLNHPNLIQIFDVGEDEGRYYFSMEYVEGECVGDVLDRIKVITPLKALDIIGQVVGALCQAHEHRIVHRDIKPDNIMLTMQGVAKLADLGIAKTDEIDADQTEPGMQMGTARYISPEQANDASKVDIRADIYSLGATFFHLVTGRTAITGKTLPVVLMKLATEPTPNATEFNPEVPWALSALIKKMMAKNPMERFQDPMELLAEMTELREELVSGKKSKRVALGSREKITIEAPSDVSGLDLELVALSEPSSVPKISLKDTDGDGQIKSGASRVGSSGSNEQLKNSRMTAGDRILSGVHKKPKLETNSKAPLYAGAAGIALVAIIGFWAAFGGGSSGTTDAGGNTTKKSPRRGTGREKHRKPVELTEAEKAEKEARKEWDSLAMLRVGTLPDEDLERLERSLQALRSSYPETTVFPKVEKRLKSILREKQRREYSEVAEKAEEHKGRGEFAKGLAVLDKFAASSGESHSQWSAMNNKRRGLLGASTQAANNLISQAGRLEQKGKLREAIRGLEEAMPRHSPESQGKLSRCIVGLDKKLKRRTLELQVQLYQPYFEKLWPKLTSQSYGEAVTLARSALKGPLGQAISAEAELADLTAVKVAWDTLDKNLKALEGREATLKFLGDETSQTVKILKVDTKRSRISLQTSLKRYTSLHRESLIKLSGASVSPEQLHGRLRLSLLLATIGRREEASEIMSQCTQDPAFPLFQLRMFIWNMAEIRKLLAGISKKPTAVWLTAIKKMHKLQVQYAGSPYLEVTVKQRHQWAGKARNHLPARTLLKRAVSLKRRSPKQALELCEILVTFYGRTRQAQEAAKMIKSLPR